MDETGRTDDIDAALDKREPWVTGRDRQALRQIYRTLNRLDPKVADLSANLGGWWSAPLADDLHEAIHKALDAVENLLMLH